MRTLTASAIFGQFILGRQDRKVRFENAMAKTAARLPLILNTHCTLVMLALAASNVKNLQHF
jgi:hypothetical protein